MKNSLFLIILMITGMTSACSNLDRTARSRSIEETVMPSLTDIENTTSAEGSLWRGNSSKAFFYQDPRAGQVGDLVKVMVVENAKGSKDAATKTGRTSSIKATTGASLGLPTNTTDNLQVGGSYTDQFDGNGSTSRDQSLTATVPSVVTRVYPNGNLFIKGRREVMINNEKALISVAGIIRPEDIGPQNTIISTAIAEAKIEYTGKGILADKQHPGWLTRILAWVWPF
jgi:flagellar L-ring protein precursor FlgH